MYSAFLMGMGWIMALLAGWTVIRPSLTARVPTGRLAGIWPLRRTTPLLMMARLVPVWISLMFFQGISRSPSMALWKVTVPPISRTKVPVMVSPFVKTRVSVGFLLGAGEAARARVGRRSSERMAAEEMRRSLIDGRM